MTIGDVAKLAGVSSAAVSRYFNNGYVSEEKREAIRRAVEQTGYRPSIQAQTLRTRRTMSVGVIAPRLASHAVGTTVDGILSVLNDSEYRMILAVTQNDPQKELDYLWALNGSQVDGVILIATVFTKPHLALLKKMKIPVVIVGQHLDGYHCVYHDDYHAMYDMTKMVLKKGRKNPGYIGVTQEDVAAGALRLQGYIDALTQNGFEAAAKQTVTAQFSMASGYEKAGEMCDTWPDIDALICATDPIAAGAISFLHSRGIRVPEDILVTGHGNYELTKVMDPPMPTVHYAYEKSGEMAALTILELMRGEAGGPKDIKLGYYIVDKAGENYD